MNLEDFKSFRRVLKPSEVGSIPTHSRHFVTWLVAFGIVLGCAAAPAEAEEPPPLDPSAFQRAVRSAVFPAWGQLTNGKSKKAVVLFAVQSYLITRVVEETRAANESKRRLADVEGSGLLDPATLAAEDAARESSQDHFDTRRDLVFWLLVTGFYGAIDAYVDAHLGDFSKDLEESRGVFSGANPVTKSVELGVRF